MLSKSKGGGSGGVVSEKEEAEGIDASSAMKQRDEGAVGGTRGTGPDLFSSRPVATSNEYKVIAHAR